MEVWRGFPPEIPSWSLGCQLCWQPSDQEESLNALAYAGEEASSSISTAQDLVARRLTTDYDTARTTPEY